jgi:hypothetical protein
MEELSDTLPPLDERDVLDVVEGMGADLACTE